MCCVEFYRKAESRTKWLIWLLALIGVFTVIYWLIICPLVHAHYYTLVCCPDTNDRDYLSNTVFWIVAFAIWLFVLLVIFLLWVCCCCSQSSSSYDTSHKELRIVPSEKTVSRLRLSASCKRKLGISLSADEAEILRRKKEKKQLNKRRHSSKPSPSYPQVEIKTNQVRMQTPDRLSEHNLLLTKEGSDDRSSILALLQTISIQPQDTSTEQKKEDTKKVVDVEVHEENRKSLIKRVSSRIKKEKEEEPNIEITELPEFSPVSERDSRKLFRFPKLESDEDETSKQEKRLSKFDEYLHLVQIDIPPSPETEVAPKIIEGKSVLTKKQENVLKDIKVLGSNKSSENSGPEFVSVEVETKDCPPRDLNQEQPVSADKDPKPASLGRTAPDDVMLVPDSPRQMFPGSATELDDKLTVESTNGPKSPREVFFEDLARPQSNRRNTAFGFEPSALTRSRRLSNFENKTWCTDDLVEEHSTGGGVKGGMRTRATPVDKKLVRRATECFVGGPTRLDNITSEVLIPLDDEGHVVAPPIELGRFQIITESHVLHNGTKLSTT